MSKEDERAYKAVNGEMTDRLLALASQVAAEAVQRGVSYRLACHAVKVALYQGLFSAALRELKNKKIMPSNLKMEDAFASGEHHELVVHEMLQLAVAHLEVADSRSVWRMNIVKRKRTSSDP